MGVIGCILKVSVILLTITWHFQQIFQFKVAGELIVEPSWSTIKNHSSSCILAGESATERGLVLLHGSPLHTCSIQITTSENSLTSLKLIGTDGYFFMYVKREGNLNECLNRFVLIDTNTKECGGRKGNVTFKHADLKVHLQGNVSLAIGETFETDGAFKCPDVRKINISRNEDTIVNCYDPYLVGFNNLITCSRYDDPICRLDLKPHCNASLGNREIEFSCLEGDSWYTSYSMIYFPLYLITLDVSFDNVKTIKSKSFIGLGTLENLFLDNNMIFMIADGAFQGLNNLFFLHLNKNQLEHIPQTVLHGLFNLYSLAFHENLLVSLKSNVFQDLINLGYLQLQYNRLTIIPNGLFSDLRNLEGLYLHGNQLTSLDKDTFLGLNKLLYLYIFDNPLFKLPTSIFKGLRSLDYLYMDQIYIEELSVEIFEDLSSLTILSLHQNYLSTLPTGIFQNLLSLSILYLHDNDLSALPFGIFKDLSSLSILYLHDNNLSTLPFDIFQTLSSLTDLHLYDNDLITLPFGIFKNLSSLSLLYLFNNHLSTLPLGIFEDLSSLSVLYLYYNDLKALPLGIFNETNNLAQLALQYNKFETIDAKLFHGLNKLYEIDFTGNRLKELPPFLCRDLPSLTKLLFTGNYLVELETNTFDGSYNLQVLTLYDNKIRQISETMFKNLSNLEVLTLRNNSLTDLPKQLFYGLKSLNILYLEINTLTRLDIDLFKDLGNLTFLDLSYNHLQETPDLKYLQRVTFINLISNPFTYVSRESFSGRPQFSDLYVSQHEICECYDPFRITCSASDNRSPYLTCDRLLSDRVLVAMMWLIGLNAMCGNAFVIIWRKKTTKKSKVQDLLLSNLAMSDFFMGIYMTIIASADIYFGDNFPMQSENWRSGITCRISGAIAITSSEASVFFVTLISIDRFVSIRFPMSTKNLSKIKASVIIFVTWLISIALGTVPSVLAAGQDNFEFYDNSHVCIGLPLALTKSYSTNRTTQTINVPKFDTLTYEKSSFTTTFEGLITGMYYSSAVFLGLNCICYLIILGCYISIVVAVKQSSKRSGRTLEMKEQIKLTTKVTTIVATDFLCWFPIIILGILVQARVLELPPSVYAWAITFVLPINSAINPYLYTIADLVSKYRDKASKAADPTAGRTGAKK